VILANSCDRGRRAFNHLQLGRLFNAIMQVAWGDPQSVQRFAQWREEGDHRTKELGLCSKVNRIAAESLLQEILRPINESANK
jgi:hypothetical protein